MPDGGASAADLHDCNNDALCQLLQKGITCLLFVVSPSVPAVAYPSTKTNLEHWTDAVFVSTVRARKINGLTFSRLRKPDFQEIFSLAGADLDRVAQHAKLFIYMHTQQDDDQHTHYLKQLKTAFDLFDIDDSGYLDEGELAQALEELGFHLDPPQVALMFQEADQQCTNQITFTEFTNLVYALEEGRYGTFGVDGFSVAGRLQAYREGKLEELRDVFSMFDSDSSGALAVDELSDVFSSLGFKEAGGEEELTFEQFVRMTDQVEAGAFDLVFQERTAGCLKDLRSDMQMVKTVRLKQQRIQADAEEYEKTVKRLREGIGIKNNEVTKLQLQMEADNLPRGERLRLMEEKMKLTQKMDQDRLLLRETLNKGKPRFDMDEMRILRGLQMLEGKKQRHRRLAEGVTAGDVPASVDHKQLAGAFFADQEEQEALAAAQEKKSRIAEQEDRAQVIKNRLQELDTTLEQLLTEGVDLQWWNKDESLSLAEKAALLRKGKRIGELTETNKKEIENLQKELADLEQTTEVLTNDEEQLIKSDQALMSLWDEKKELENQQSLLKERLQELSEDLKDNLSPRAMGQLSLAQEAAKNWDGMHRALDQSRKDCLSRLAGIQKQIQAAEDKLEQPETTDEEVLKTLELLSDLLRQQEDTFVTEDKIQSKYDALLLLRPEEDRRAPEQPSKADTPNTSTDDSLHMTKRQAVGFLKDFQKNHAHGGGDDRWNIILQHEWNSPRLSKEKAPTLVDSPTVSGNGSISPTPKRKLRAGTSVGTRATHGRAKGYLVMMREQEEAERKKALETAKHIQEDILLRRQRQKDHAWSLTLNKASSVPQISDSTYATLLTKTAQVHSFASLKQTCPGLSQDIRTEPLPSMKRGSMDRSHKKQAIVPSPIDYGLGLVDERPSTALPSFSPMPSRRGSPLAMHRPKLAYDIYPPDLAYCVLPELARLHSMMPASVQPHLPSTDQRSLAPP
eukprot:gene8752-25_t